MTPSGNKIDFDFELDSRLAVDERLRFCTKRASRPIGSRFETRCLARCSASEVVRRISSACELHCRHETNLFSSILAAIDKRGKKKLAAENSLADND
jgi:hypothetical protein